MPAKDGPGIIDLVSWLPGEATWSGSDAIGWQVRLSSRPDQVFKGSSWRASIENALSTLVGTETETCLWCGAPIEGTHQEGCKFGRVVELFGQQDQVTGNDAARDHPPQVHSATGNDNNLPLPVLPDGVDSLPPGTEIVRRQKDWMISLQETEYHVSNIVGQ